MTGLSPPDKSVLVEQLRLLADTGNGPTSDTIVLRKGRLRTWADVIEQLPDGKLVSELLDLILVEMPVATARDLACDGPVGDEEEGVWGRIEAKARELRSS